MTTHLDRRAFLAGALAVPALVAFPGTGSTGHLGRRPRAAAAGPSKVLVIFGENHTRDQAIGPKGKMPYLRGLAGQYGQATNFQAASHPSLPNYLVAAFGQTFGVTDDRPPKKHPINAPSVFGQALSHGRTAHVYAEGEPANCTLDNYDPTHYVVRHTGWPYAVAAGERQACQAMHTDTDRLPGDIDNRQLPNVGWLTPSNLHNAHTPSNLQDFDAWLRPMIARLTAGPDWQAGDLTIVVTFDEGKDANQNVACVVIHPSLSGVVVSARYGLADLYRSQVRYGGGLVSGADVLAAFAL